MLLIPLSLSLVMAWTDIQRKRIPNYLTLGSALAGLGFQLGFYGQSGVMDGLMGIGLGFALLICFYWLGGLGAGDVKALAALGGPRQTVDLFIYMALSGLGVMIFFLWRRGLLLSQIRRLGTFLMNWVLLRPTSGRFPSPSAAPRTSKSEGIPYAVALALGMAILCYRNFTG
jgi:prepilin peptidase CpaA